MKINNENDKLIRAIVAEARMIHNEYGPGLMDNFYEIKLLGRIRKLGHSVRKRIANGFPFENKRYARMFRVDLIIDETLLLEIKATDQINDFFVKQISRYLLDTDIKLGLIINFGQDRFRDCIKRVLPQGPLPKAGDYPPLKAVI